MRPRRARRSWPPVQRPDARALQSCDPGFGSAELVEDSRRLLGRRLLERAPEIGDGAVRGAASECGPGGGAQRLHGPRVVGNRRNEELSCDPFRLRVGLGEETRGSRVTSVFLDRRELRVDGSANDRMDEREGSVATEDLDAAQAVAASAAVVSVRPASAAARRRSASSPKMATACARLVAAAGGARVGGRRRGLRRVHPAPGGGGHQTP